tara:strand:- start:64 stop:405 length:342 start_codon:yes stop_codon:yes gene_type:complete
MPPPLITQAAAEAAAIEAAVARACELSPRRFALEAPADEARRRDVAFQAAAAQWRHERRERESRAAVASAARALVAATAYAQSGGSQLAPLLAGVLGGSRTVDKVVERVANGK